MKKFKSVLMLVAVILIGAGAAFATNAAKDSDNESVHGYYLDSTTGLCEVTNQLCSTTGSEVCTWSEDSDIQLFRMTNETTCEGILYKQP